MTPNDYEAPEWGKATKVHDWRNYPGDELKAMWHTFTLEQRAILARAFQDIADREEWD